MFNIIFQLYFCCSLKQLSARSFIQIRGRVMLNVLIIDDDLKDSKDLEKLCIHYFNKRNIDYKINIELKLNENLDTFSNVDILFLDVEIGNNNGIEFSKNLEKFIRN